MLSLPAIAAALSLLSASGSSAPFQYDSIGPIRDVTAQWTHYQPAGSFCIRPEQGQYTPGGVGATVSGRDPACRRSGFPRSTKGLVVIHLRTPALCAGCRRLFIDFSRIPSSNSGARDYARGHVYYHLSSANPSYTVDPIAHSPNTKNFTNDKLIAPTGSVQEHAAYAIDLHAIAYVSDTTGFIHTKIQGPYYIGPWYVNRVGQRIHGLYLDVDVADATSLGNPQLDEIFYADGFNSAQRCPNDDDAFYVGCVDWWSYSASSVDPFERP